MKYLKLYEDFNKNYVLAKLVFEITEKAKKWFENPKISELTTHYYGTYKIDKVGKLEYLFQDFPVVIENMVTDNLRVDVIRSQREMSGLVYSSRFRNEYNEITLKLSQSSHANLPENYLTGLNLNTTSNVYSILIGKGSFEYSDHLNNQYESEETSYNPEFNYYATIGFNLEEDSLILYPMILITMEDGDDIEIIDVLYEVWGEGNQYGTLFEIEYDKLVNKEKYEDQHAWFKLSDVVIQQNPR